MVKFRGILRDQVNVVKIHKSQSTISSRHNTYTRPKILSLSATTFGFHLRWSRLRGWWSDVQGLPTRWKEGKKWKKKPTTAVINNGSIDRCEMRVNAVREKLNLGIICLKSSESFGRRGKVAEMSGDWTTGEGIWPAKKTTHQVIVSLMMAL